MSNTPYGFGELVTIARAAFARSIATRVAAQGYAGFRRSDPAAMRLVAAAPRSIGELAASLGVTRQAARKFVNGLEARGYVHARNDPSDRRRVVVMTTARGAAYASVLSDAVAKRNREVTKRLSINDLRAFDRVIRSSVRDEALKRWAEAVAPPG